MDIRHICVGTSQLALHYSWSVAMQNQSWAWVNHQAAQAALWMHSKIHLLYTQESSIITLQWKF